MLEMKPLAVGVAVAAKLLSLSQPTIRLYVRTGRLKGTRCGRRLLIPTSELARLVQEGAPTRTELAAERS
jgi:excisionase family DNA binding protein